MSDEELNIEFKGYDPTPAYKPVNWQCAPPGKLMDPEERIRAHLLDLYFKTSEKMEQEVNEEMVKPRLSRSRCVKIMSIINNTFYYYYIHWWCKRANKQKYAEYQIAQMMVNKVLERNKSKYDILRRYREGVASLDE